MSQSSRNTSSRRKFLEDSMFATAAAIAASSAGGVAMAADEPQSTSPNERLNVAVIGVNGQGNTHLGAYASRKDTRVAVICDVDKNVGMKRVEEVAKKQGHTPKYVQDLREVFDDKTIDCVTTATPNHWHALVAIWAMQAGKDVYVEKPVSHNVSEGRRIVEVARKHNRICQTGTQSRSMVGMQECIAYVHSGKLGDVTLARGLCYKPRGKIGERGEYTVPQQINYDLWSGPAQIKPLTRPRLHYDWHWQWDYGNGDLGNQGIHQMDLARWGLNVDTLSSNVLSYGGRFGYEDAGETANTQVIVHDYGKKTLVFEVRGLKTEKLQGAGVGVIFYGTEGYLVCPSYNSGTVFDKDGKVVKSFDKGGDHHGNFIKAVRSRKSTDLNADILEGHLSSALCHTGNISYRLGEDLTTDAAMERLKELPVAEEATKTFDRFKSHLADNGVKLEKVRIGGNLKFDPKAEKFVDNSAADAMLTRQYRAPFVVPSAENI